MKFSNKKSAYLKKINMPRLTDRERIKKIFFFEDEMDAAILFPMNQSVAVQIISKRTNGACHAE